jgi:hypothetical protein
MYILYTWLYTCMYSYIPQHVPWLIGLSSFSTQMDSQALGWRSIEVTSSEYRSDRTEVDLSWNPAPLFCWISRFFPVGNLVFLYFPRWNTISILMCLYFSRWTGVFSDVYMSEMVPMSSMIPWSETFQVQAAAWKGLDYDAKVGRYAGNGKMWKHVQNIFNMMYYEILYGEHLWTYLVFLSNIIC